MEIEARGKPISAKYPLPTADMSAGTNRESVAVEGVTFVGKAAAGSVGINALDKKPILNKVGDKVGSYWGRSENKVWRTGENNSGKVTALTETASSADITILDRDNNLELLFESSTTARFVLRVYDTSGNSLYGFIEGVAVSSGSYTFTIYNNVTFSAGAQSWVGDLTAFDNTNIASAEIYSYESSIIWSTGTVLTKEVAYNDTFNDIEFLNNLNNGEYGVDYENGRILYKRATTGGSDAITYSVPGISSTSISTGDINLKQVNGNTTESGAGSVGTGSQRVTVGSTSAQALGTDATGADTYATVLTSVALATHICISLGGSYGAIISLNAGTTDHIYVPANTVICLDNITIAAATAIQAKNASAGNNYSGLYITIW